MKRRRVLHVASLTEESAEASCEASHNLPTTNQVRHRTMSRRHHSQKSPSSFEIRMSLVVFFVILVTSLVVPGSCFHLLGAPALRTRQNQFELYLVEPTERTDELYYHTIASDASSRVHHGGDVFQSLGIQATDIDVEQIKEEEASVEGDNHEGHTYEDPVKYQRLANTAKAAAMLARRSSSRPGGKMSSETTSVGDRRFGSASKALSGAGSFSQLTEAVKRASIANTSKPNKEKAVHSGSSLSRSISEIQATVESMMHTSMGLFGEAEPVKGPATFFDRPHVPLPGTVLLCAERSNKVWKAAERISVRVATMADDLDIANLRLSVFSDFSPDMRRAFCAKSCQVLATRRNRGATCIAATVPRYGSIMMPRPDIILGTAECSFHEFEGTALGRRRLMDAILYITEVAVSPTARRKGIGQKLMEVSAECRSRDPVRNKYCHAVPLTLFCHAVRFIQSIDELANIRGVETLFLHVDTTNIAALSLYKQAGYSMVPPTDPMYQEFTRSLNLHDGATKGRNHYLLMKNLLRPTWLPEYHMQQLESGTGILGFDITA